jgi:HlyD family secretion protein
VKETGFWRSPIPIGKPVKDEAPMRKRRLVKTLLFLAVIGALGSAGYGFFRARRTQAAGNLPTAPVRKGDFAVIVRCRGEIGARRSVQLAAPRNVPDLRIIWQAQPGSRVKAGDVVVRFDPSSARRQLDENSAALRQAEATLDQATAQARITSEQDKLDLANAQYQVERAKLEASKQAIVSAIQGESSKIDLASAEAKLRVQQATVQLHGRSDESRIASVRRQRDKAQADVDLNKQRLEQMNMKTPLDGMISYALNYSQGWMNAQPFKVGDQVWPGGIVAEIPDPETLEMQGKVEEVERGQIVAGNEVRVHVDAFPEQVFSATLKNISPLTEMSFEWPPVRSFLGYAPILKPDARLRTGMNGSMDVVIRHIPDALSVPAKAIFTRSGKPVVYLAEVKGYRPVEVGVLARNPDEVAITGVSTGATVTLAEPEGEKAGGRP